MSRGWVVLLCMVLVGCSGTAPRIREAPEQPQRCIYVPRREGAAGARNEAAPSAHAGMRVVLVAATAGASPAAPLAPRSAPSLEGLSGESLGEGVPRIRGREQQLMDSLGCARSDTGAPCQTENAVRGVAKDNPRGRLFHTSATELWGELSPYTGY